MHGFYICINVGCAPSSIVIFRGWVWCASSMHTNLPKNIRVFGIDRHFGSPIVFLEALPLSPLLGLSSKLYLLFPFPAYSFSNCRMKHSVGPLSGSTNSKQMSKILWFVRVNGEKKNSLKKKILRGLFSSSFAVHSTRRFSTMSRRWTASMAILTEATAERYFIASLRIRASRYLISWKLMQKLAQTKCHNVKVELFPAHCIHSFQFSNFFFL